MIKCRHCDRFWQETEDDPKERGLCFREYGGKIYPRFGASKICPKFTPYVETTVEEEMEMLSKDAIDPKDLPKFLERNRKISK